MGNIETKLLDAGIVEKAAATIRRRRDKLGPYAAQLGGAAHWYALLTHPGRERTAAAHLIGRGFGIYLPEQEAEAVNRHGAKERSLRLLFPGYLFVLVWGIEGNLPRMLACTGVADILRKSVGEDDRGKMKFDPLVVPDGVIDEIRALENRLRPIRVVMDVVLTKKKRHRQSHKTVKRELQIGPDDVAATYTRSYLRDVKELDDRGRIDALRRALGLGS